MDNKTINLGCFGIEIELEEVNQEGIARGGTIRSDLKEEGQPNNWPFNAAMDALESIVLGHACAGVDVESYAYIEGIEIAVDSIANNFID
jgi:hypothetical protein